MRPIFIIIALAGWLTPVVAQQQVSNPPPGWCVATAKSCIIVTMTPDEVNSLIGQNGIFDQAEWASRSSMGPLVQAWKQKLANSPPGKVIDLNDKKTEDKITPDKPEEKNDQ